MTQTQKNIVKELRTALQNAILPLDAKGKSKINAILKRMHNAR